MQEVIIKPSAAIRQNYSMVSKLCRKTGEPVYLTKNGDGDLVVMDIPTYCRRLSLLDLRERLVEVEELRQLGVKDMDVAGVIKIMGRIIEEYRRELQYMRDMKKRMFRP